MAPGIAEKKNNSLPLWGNTNTMNLNNLIMTNILSSHYFKNNLYQLKTYHEVIDEIYYQVNHLEPWEKGSRKTSGQTGMCGGVRGVGAGGIVSTAFCILYKLFTLKLTRKQLVGLINHTDSPYIRALGFMYIRYTQPPGDLYDWFENYLDDEEDLDVKAGGGQVMTIGEMLRHFLSKLEWFSTLFPRIPVPIQKDLERKLASWRSRSGNKAAVVETSAEWAEGGDQAAENEDWSETAERSVTAPDDQEKEYVEPKASHTRSNENDPHRDKSKHRSNRREGERTSGSSHHSSNHHRNHGSHRERSRSPRRSDSKHSKDDEKRSKRRHHDKERDHSIEKDRKSRKRHESPDSKYPEDYNHERKHDRKHSHSHRHEHSKHHERREHHHSRNHH